MKNTKGISMISLIITIIVTILLASLAIGTGSKYLKESKSRDRTNFISVLSSAVSKRQEDINVNSNMYPYLGYHISDADFFDQVIVPKVNESLSFEEGVWYIVDTKSATKLGVRESENYIDTIHEGTDLNDKITVALVNYASGRTYLVNVFPSEISGLPEAPVTENGHTHRYLIDEPTCTEPLKCADCGYILKEAKGHVYSGDASKPKPTVGDEANSHYARICSVCGMPSGYAPHIFEYVYIDASNPWRHKRVCKTCGYPEDDSINSENCSLKYNLPELATDKERYHIVTCKYCLHTENELHDIKYRKISEAMHEKYCGIAGCSLLIATEFHRDDNDDDLCDDCGSQIIDYSYPILNLVTIVNNSAVTDENKYIATYGDELKLVIEADKKVQNLEVKISGMVATNMTTTDEKRWVIIYELDKTKQTFNEGIIPFSITCETKDSGISILSPVTQPTDGKNVFFDVSDPLGGYVEKNQRIDEIN